MKLFYITLLLCSLSGGCVVNNDPRPPLINNSSFVDFESSNYETQEVGG